MGFPNTSKAFKRCERLTVAFRLTRSTDQKGFSGQYVWQERYGYTDFYCHSIDLNVPTDIDETCCHGCGVK